MTTQSQTPQTFRQHLYKIIFDSDTTVGRLFDKFLIVAIILSMLVVILDSVASIAHVYHLQLSLLEWLFTILFTIEYLARIYATREKLRYMTSFFGIIDLLAVLPTYLALIFPEMHALIDVRVLRLIRIFRVFKLTAYVSEYVYLANALKASKRKILVFLSVVLIVVMLMGSLMYVIEGPTSGFTSIPVGIYWAITTMTTVGFGDITPKTDLGRLLSSVMMLMGWGTLAVPTGIVTAEVTHQSRGLFAQHACPACGKQELKVADNFCSHCGYALQGSGNNRTTPDEAAP